MLLWDSHFFLFSYEFKLKFIYLFLVVDCICGKGRKGWEWKGCVRPEKGELCSFAAWTRLGLALAN